MEHATVFDCTKNYCLKILMILQRIQCFEHFTYNFMSFNVINSRSTFPDKSRSRLWARDYRRLPNRRDKRTYRPKWTWMQSGRRSRRWSRSSRATRRRPARQWRRPQRPRWSTSRTPRHPPPNNHDPSRFKHKKIKAVHRTNVEIGTVDFYECLTISNITNSIQYEIMKNLSIGDNCYYWAFHVRTSRFMCILIW